ncbi:MAG: ATP-dependent protease subunit HslV [Gemmatimonadetes bacterium]|nr:ATP-dependent protease subunit HslV [Gemmatimonadota bacterium]
MPPVPPLTSQATVRATTVLAVRRNGNVAMGGDGQVTMGDIVVKGAAKKVRLLREGQVLAGFAGAVADAFALFDKLDGKLERWPSNLPRACVELAKEWRTDRYLRRLEALLVVADRDHLFLVGGDGNVIEPDDPVLAIGSGGAYALAAARALYEHSDLGSREIVTRALEIAGDICVYTNREITVLELDLSE